MRKNFGTKTWLYPMPVFIVAAYDAEGKPNAMNAAWGGMHTDNMVGICLAEEHKTTQNILSTKAFTVSMGTVEQHVAKLNPILYDPIRHDYRAMGEKVGKAFSDGRALK